MVQDGFPVRAGAADRPAPRAADVATKLRDAHRGLIDGLEAIVDAELMIFQAAAVPHVMGPCAVGNHAVCPGSCWACPDCQEACECSCHP